MGALQKMHLPKGFKTMPLLQRPATFEEASTNAQSPVGAFAHAGQALVSYAIEYLSNPFLKAASTGNNT